MKRVYQIIPTVATLLGLALPCQAVVIVNDTWTDGSRAEQNLPAESRWFAANRASNFVTTAGSMTFTPEVGTSRAGLTYFAASGSPVALADGDMLKVTTVFTPGTMSANSARSMRFAVANYSAGGTRLTADGTSSGMSGASVLGYGLFLNMSTTFGLAPLDIMERTTPSNTDLLGASSAWTSFGSGGGAAGDPGFVSGTPYAFTFSLGRVGSELLITTAFSGGSWNISHTVTDTTPSTFSFDAFAFRASDRENTAASFQFTNFKVEVLPVPEPATCALLGLSMFGLSVWRLRRS